VNAVIGALVTIVTSFTGISPIIGGAVAGYLNRRDGAKVGALSGVIASIPLLVVLFLLGGVFAFLPFAGGMGPRGGMAVGLAGIFLGLFVFAIALLYSAGLGALGGYLGVYLYREDVL